jgi:DNA replicative helicase MCM subunit Mcm2 (Cdc46/Mcm family)
LQLRSENTLGAAYPVTARVLENLIRLSQARARMELRDVVSVCIVFDRIYFYSDRNLTVFPYSNF